MKTNPFLTSVFGALVVLVLMGCSHPAEGQPGSVATSADPYRDYGVAEFAEGSKKPGAVLLDIRTPEEVVQARIRGSIHIDWYSDSFKSDAGKLDRNKPVYVYCAAGGRSSDALRLLKSMGFKEVHQLSGGMGAWQAAGMPVEKGGAGR